MSTLTTLRWLNDTHHIRVPQDWLEACVEWIQTSDSDGATSQDNIQQSVYEQWLYSNLTDLAATCLPNNLQNIEKTTITGPICLQINAILDVSKPYYKQIQQITGKENENAMVNAATQQSQHSWEAKPTRLLMLTLTDGVQVIKGMEYHPIPCLDIDTLPGTKIRISGTVLCRRAVLFLTRNNVEVLGGEVENMMKDGHLSKLLNDTLKSNVEFGKTNHGKMQHFEPKSFKPVGKLKQEILPQNIKQELCSQNTAQQSFHQSSNPSWFKQCQSSTHQINNDRDLWADDDLDGFDVPDEELFSNVDFGEENVKTVKKEPTEKAQWKDEFEEMEAQMAEADQSYMYSTARKSSNSNVPTINRQNAKHHPASTARQMFKENTKSNNLLDKNPLHRNNTNTQYPTSRNNTSSIERNALKQVVTGKSTTIHKASNPHTVQRIDSFFTQPTKKQRIGSSNSNTAIPTKSEFLSGHADTVDAFVDEFMMDSDDDFIVPDDSTSSTNKQDRKELGLDAQPWTYISIIKKHFPLKTKCTVRIKAYISTLLGKLDHNKGTRWSIPARLNDGSGVLDVELGDEMLASLIGFSAPSSSRMKLAAKTDPNVRTTLNEGIKNCQKSLVQLLSVLEIQLDPNNKPLVLRICDVTKEDLELLKRRL